MDPPTSPNPQIPSIIQSCRCKSTISSLLLSTFSNTNTTNEATPINSSTKKKNNFTSTTFRGLGCTVSASQQVSVPAVIQWSADWEAKKSRKKKKNPTPNSTPATPISSHPFQTQSQPTPP
ncbi:hypothetical protein CMV_001453 [Castanea mollissima]|uniref:Uncharacterized protein n=1 Tax=Castanea mollissima TaxID=60419 RepID=A0A8J4S2I2_9ROSI|nr:hypothetical protein CMV_001453 [Castanea mollissima]